MTEYKLVVVGGKYALLKHITTYVCIGNTHSPGFDLLVR